MPRSDPGRTPCPFVPEDPLYTREGTNPIRKCRNRKQLHHACFSTSRARRAPHGRRGRRRGRLATRPAHGAVPIEIIHFTRAREQTHSEKKELERTCDIMPVHSRARRAPRVPRVVFNPCVPGRAEPWGARVEGNPWHPAASWCFSSREQRAGMPRDQVRCGFVRDRSPHEPSGTKPFPNFQNQKDLRHLGVSFFTRHRRARHGRSGPRPSQTAARVRPLGDPRGRLAGNKAIAEILKRQRVLENDLCKLRGKSAAIARTVPRKRRTNRVRALRSGPAAGALGSGRGCRRGRRR
jgi:hypothetical protein